MLPKIFKKYSPTDSLYSRYIVLFSGKCRCLSESQANVALYIGQICHEKDYIITGWGSKVGNILNIIEILRFLHLFYMTEIINFLQSERI